MGHYQLSYLLQLHTRGAGPRDGRVCPNLPPGSTVQQGGEGAKEQRHGLCRYGA